VPPMVKICGLTTAATLNAAIAGGASHIGLVFFGKSPRNVTTDRASALVQIVPAAVRVVALVVDPTEDLLAQILSSVRVDVLQLHGHEPPERVAAIRQRHGRETWKALPVRTAADRDAAARYAGAADMILYDAKPPEGSVLPGGNGLRFDWELLRGHRHPLPWGLSGGLDADNVANAIRITGAPLVDVSSGVESVPGVKDVDKIAAFLKATQL
jgi:phosphoribosylanthranilate isomerase